MNIHGANISSPSAPPHKRRRTGEEKELKVTGQTFNLLALLGSGSFGVVYRARNLRTRELVALKIEPLALTITSTALSHERKVLHKLAGLAGVPRLRRFGMGSEGELALALDLLGPSIDGVVRETGGKLGLKSVLFLAPQMLRVVREVHEKHFIHRDLKPENFCLGYSRDEEGAADHVFLIDFGLAKRYRNPRGRRHIPLRGGKTLVGTTRYASINAHLGLELSRRDDLESLGYALIYLLKGRLPWQGLAASEKVNVERVGEKKQAVSLFELCQAIPPEFEVYMKYCRALKFDETPNYDQLESLFLDLFDRMGYVRDGVYDWTKRAE